MIEHIIYTIAFLLMIGLSYSYGFAFYLNKKLHILALFLFFTEIGLMVFGTVWQVYSKTFTGEMMVLPGRTARGIFLCLTAGFLLYTTWKKNNVSK